jgi:predicted  nucleic acid-binding Zn-ribbon protein
MQKQCPLCGKIRTGHGERFERATRCADCYNAERGAKRARVVCPKCGCVKFRKLSNQRPGTEGYCKTCARLTDASIPDTYEAGYVFGVVLGDGYLFVNPGVVRSSTGHKTKGYGVRLEVKSEAFARKFARYLEECAGRKPWMKGCAHKGAANEALKMPAQDWTRWTVVLGSREWCDKLVPVKKHRNFDLLRGTGVDFKRGFVDGMVDSEGYVCRKVSPPYTDVANKDIELLNLTRDFLRDLGYRSRIYGPYSYSRGVAHLRTVPWEKTV